MAVKKKTIEKTDSSLQIDESLSLHKTGWKVQRIGWAVIIIIMVMGIFGLFGEGLLSEQKPTAGNINVKYERFFRYEAEMEIHVESKAEHISQISFPQEYLKHFKLVRFVPAPENNTTAAGDVMYNFLPAENRIVTIYLTPTDNGRIDGNMKVNGSNGFTLHHYIYP